MTGFTAVIVAIVLDAALGWPSGGTYALYGVTACTFVVVGWLVVERQPGNAVGPLLLLFGVVFAIWLPMDLILHLPDPPGWADVLAVLAATLDAPMFIVLGVSLVLFPNGSLPTSRWRPILRIAAFAVAAVVIGYLLDPDPVPIYPDHTSPIGIPGFPGDVLVYAGYAAMLVILVAGAVAVVVRWRSGDLVQRAQIKWVVAAGFVVLVIEIINVATFDPANLTAPIVLLATLVLALVPLAIGVAILRYRLYEIDRIVSRTISYAIVTGLLAVTFATTIIVLQSFLAQVTGGQSVAVAASTLAALALFQPVLRRVRHAVDRRFDRARYDAERTALAFSERLRDQTDMAAVTGDLAGTVRGAVAPASLAIWLRTRGANR